MASDFDDSQKIREFYDPHPCPIGALDAVPGGKIKRVLDQLNGQSMSVYEARNKMVAALDEGRLEVDLDKKHITLEVRYYHGRRYDAGHRFILIKFR